MTSIWLNPFFYLFLAVTLLLLGTMYHYLRASSRKTAEMKLLQQQHAARIDVLRKEHNETLEKLRTEMLKREEDRSRQWMESEKETLRVLNGVSSLLSWSERIGRVESDKIMKKLETIQNQIIKIKESRNDKNGSTEGSE